MGKRVLFSVKCHRKYSIMIKCLGQHSGMTTSVGVTLCLGQYNVRENGCFEGQYTGVENIFRGGIHLLRNSGCGQYNTRMNICLD